MKKGRKALLVLACAGCLVVGSVFGTLAYLTSEDNVTNTFTVGDVAIKLDEADVDVYGKKDTENRVDKNEYKLIPGHTYVKDPTVTVEKGSEQSYVKMIVTITDAVDLLEVLGSDFLPENYVEGWDASVWVSKKNDSVSNDQLVYEFWYKDVVDARTAEITLPALFTEFTFPETVNNENLSKLEELEIRVEAHAIQADGFASAEAAWAAYTN